ncbi:MAG: bifunctional DNA-formamidopyrimidine glycosylase/DNA-(apurinic or apyrimidinic site) lyase [Acidiferrobacteraceae bacterium]|jgi:formamidopyrimidine-DNA glycosylase
MPELPEVETTRRGIAPAVTGHVVRGVLVRDRRLRWPVPPGLSRDLPGATINKVRRRAKYLLLETDRGTVIIHLGMSGSLRVVPADSPPSAYDHVDIVLDDGMCLRLRDPRRFGAVLWTRGDPMGHRLLARLGPEPLDPALDANALRARLKGRRRAIRDTLLDSHVIAGIGNIYANEALFRAGIDPRRAAGRIGRERCGRLLDALRAVLTDAIRAGGSSLRDFRRADGNPGYFQLSLQVYGRAGEPCPVCGTPIRRQVRGARSLYFCPRCQH